MALFPDRIYSIQYTYRNYEDDRFSRLNAKAFLMDISLLRVLRIFMDIT